MELASLFRGTGGTGFDYASAADVGLEYMASDSAFLENFATPFTGVNGGGPMLNADANLLPTRADNYRDIASTLDFKLNDGLGVARPFRKNDSMGGSTPGGFYGPAEPTKMFGRNSVTPDLNYERDSMTERARASFKKLGFKPDQQPNDANFQPWQWNNLNALGIGGPPDDPSSNQYNRNYTLPDADQAARLLYQPAPSRLTKMLSVDTEVASLMPQRTLLHPLKVVTEDRQRMKLQRIPRNADVIESVIYENIMPRGMGSRVGAPKSWSSSEVLRFPIGTNETGDPSVYGRWNAGLSEPLQDVQNEDRLRVANNDFMFVQGKQPDIEEGEFQLAQSWLDAQRTPDPTNITVQPGDYPWNRSNTSQALYMPKNVGRVI